MRAFWNARARENAMWFIHSVLDYHDTDSDAFWASGVDNLDRTLEVFGLEITPNDDVVEIGCGIGRMTRAIASRAAHVVGLDVSDEMIGRGRVALADVDNVELVVGTGHDLTGIADASADVVYSFIVFQHIPDPAVTCAYVREIGRVLRPGGWTLFQVSDAPTIHRPGAFRERGVVGATVRRLLGRAPRGCRAAEWRGSAVPRDELEAALADGGLALAGMAGEGTQFCLVHARKISIDKGSRSP